MKCVISCCCQPHIGQANSVSNCCHGYHVQLPSTHTHTQGLAEGEFVFQVNATDADDAFNKELAYTFEDGLTRKDPFMIDIDSGVITTTQSLDRENIERHEVNACHRYGSVPKQFSCSSLLIGQLPATQFHPGILCTLVVACCIIWKEH